jgi:hypothetical protein
MSLDSPDWMVSPVRSLAWRRSGGRYLAVALAGFAVLSSAAPAAQAAGAAAKPRVTFGIEPSGARHTDARPHFSFGVTPGASLTDHVAALNYSAKPLSLQVYATDALNTATGGFTLLAPNIKPTGAGSWITLPKRFATVTVPAGTAKGPGTVIIPFSLKVPDTASPGDHVGGIIASLQTKGENATGQNVILNQRIGTRVFVRVAGTLSPKLTVTGLHASYKGTINPVGKGSVAVRYIVKNTGNVELALNQGVTVTGLLGSKRQIAGPTVPLLLPGDSLSETAKVNGVWPEFTAKVSVTAQPLAAAGDADPHLLAVSASTHLLAIPWALIVLIVLLIALIWAGITLRRRRRSGPADAQPTVAEPVNA